jgi:hypothetical protein
MARRQEALLGLIAIGKVEHPPESGADHRSIQNEEVRLIHKHFLTTQCTGIYFLSAERIVESDSHEKGVLRWAG